MTTMNSNFHKSSTPQKIRVHNAKQLRSDFLASMFKTFYNMVRERIIHSASDVQIKTKA